MISVRDINDALPRPPSMKWGALTNMLPTPRRVLEMDRIFPDDGRWHTVLEERDQVHVDGRRVWKKAPRSWT